jgi:hypothetical protein
MKKILFLALISLFALSCATQRRCSLKFPVQSSTDSVYVEKMKEVPVYIPGDTVNVEVPVNCPDQDIFSVENSKLKQDIKILNGKLISIIRIKPDTILVHTKETVTKTKEVKVLQPVKFIPKFFKFCTWGFIFIVLSVIVYFVLKYKLKILSLITK